MKFRVPNFRSLFFSFINPAIVTLLAMTLLVGVVVLNAGGDPLELAQIGTVFSEGELNGTEGYDGQFIYYIAQNLNPDEVKALLDVPAYRYQRILLPLLGHYLALGNVNVIPWVIPIIGILAQVAGTFAVSELLNDWGISRWYGLIYGLWVGFSLAIRLDMSEPLAYGLVVGAILMSERKRPMVSWILYGLAIFAKEVTVLFLFAAILSALIKRQRRDVIGLGILAVLPFALFQVWLWVKFGQPGIGSGGAMATPFEIIPYMGLFRIGYFSQSYLMVMLLVFLPCVVLPSMWGTWSSIKRIIRGETNVVVLALLFNSLAIAFLPFSTFREPGGILRFACGLVLSVVLYAGRYQIRRVLNYSLLWLSMNVFLFKS
ncbi:MAG: hypothetical protein KAS36_14470 [Anaerolineales bacterium]|nr:hypothetical protein [Anaerolineales bacterium]